MCRFIAYRGNPILMEDVIACPVRSLIQQSLHAYESRSETNGDGFGIGWYGERDTPGLYRELRPAWSDENLRSLCANVRSPLFFAHVRAATDTSISRANCHPFSTGKLMFMHNGQIGGYQAIRRKLESMIDDEYYKFRGGTTDSEAMFLIALSLGLAEDPVGAVQRMLSKVVAEMKAAGIETALRFTATLTDGDTLWAFRWATDGEPATLYFEHAFDGLIVASEPFEEKRDAWNRVPSGHALVARRGESVDMPALHVA
jgi:glutamine amidotransferase